MKKGRHRRFEEARALKRGHDIDYESILNDSPVLGASADQPSEVADDDDDEDYDPDKWVNPEVD